MVPCDLKVLEDRTAGSKQWWEMSQIASCCYLGLWVPTSPMTDCVAPGFSEQAPAVLLSIFTRPGRPFSLDLVANGGDPSKVMLSKAACVFKQELQM